jgi:DNA-directed RNA polymerase subunit RPC12/RpoP
MSETKELFCIKCKKKFHCNLWKLADRSKDKYDNCPNCKQPKLRFLRLEGYYAISLGGQWHYGDYPMTSNNALVVETATKDYLERLELLQKEIQERYGGLLQPEGASSNYLSLNEKIKVYKEVWGDVNYRERFKKLMNLRS